MFKATKEFKFDAAHYLCGSYTGKCQNIHGHTYKVLITVKSTELNDDGMVIDFGELKECVKPIIEAYDHSIVVNSNPSEGSAKREEFIEILEQETDVKHFPGNPTAENMARLFFERICEKLPTGIMLENVKVYETPTSYAEYTEEE